MADLRSGHDYFELLQRGGVIDKDHYIKNGVGAGIVTFNIVLVAILAHRNHATTQPENFGKVCSYSCKTLHAANKQTCCC
jgi:hypothetical protein